MLEALPLLATTDLLIGVFSYFFISLQLQEIRANWEERRCEPFVIPIAHLVPADPSVNASDFAINNFEYCLSKLIDSSIAIVLAPALLVFKSQVNATGPIQSSMNYLRANAASLLKPLNDIFNSAWKQVMIVVYQIVRIFRKLASSFDRIFGIAVSTIFAGISTFKAIKNLMNLVIYVVIVILAIIAVLMIFAFYLISPILPIVLTVTAIISASVYGANKEGFSYCVAPGTLVATKDGWKSVEHLKPGDELREGVIEGILKATGDGHECVELDGIIISACHLVYDNSDKTWKSAGKHPLAKAFTGEIEALYCLNTTTRKWIVKGGQEFILRDWEELPMDPKFSEEWEGVVYSMLNKKGSVPRIARAGRGLLGKDTRVWEYKKGHIKISEISIGDYVKDNYFGYTKVVGIYHDSSTPVPLSGVNAPGWVWEPELRIWTHPHIWTDTPLFNNGYNLLTQSGIFMVNEQFVRDFTEVGADRIEETYDFVLASIDRNDEAHNLPN